MAFIKRVSLLLLLAKSLLIARCSQIAAGNDQIFSNELKVDRELGQLNEFESADESVALAPLMDVGSLPEINMAPSSMSPSGSDLTLFTVTSHDSQAVKIPVELWTLILKFCFSNTDFSQFLEDGAFKHALMVKVMNEFEKNPRKIKIWHENFLIDMPLLNYLRKVALRILMERLRRLRLVCKKWHSIFTSKIHKNLEDLDEMRMQRWDFSIMEISNPFLSKEFGVSTDFMADEDKLAMLKSMADYYESAKYVGLQKVIELQVLFPWTKIYCWKVTQINEADLEFLSTQTSIKFEPLKTKNLNLQLNLSKLSATNLLGNLHESIKRQMIGSPGSRIIAGIESDPLNIFFLNLHVFGPLDEDAFKQFEVLLEILKTSTEKLALRLIFFADEYRFSGNLVASISMTILNSVKKNLEIDHLKKFELSICFHYSHQGWANFLNTNPSPPADSVALDKSMEFDATARVPESSKSFSLVIKTPDFDKKNAPQDQIPVTKLILVLDFDYLLQISLKYFNLLKSLSIGKIDLTESNLIKFIEWLEQSSSSQLQIYSRISSCSNMELIKNFIARLIANENIINFEISAFETENEKFSLIFQKELNQYDFDILPVYESKHQFVLSYSKSLSDSEIQD